MSQNSISVFNKELLELNQQFRPIEWSSKQGHLASKLVFTNENSIDQGVIDRLTTAQEKCSQEIDPQKWAQKCNDLADAFHAKSQQEANSGIKYLNSSLESYMKVLMVWTRIDNPSEWASAFNNLGMIFMAQGERTKGKRALEKSIAAFKNSLTYRTIEENPYDWAVCQNNMGVSLRILAEISEDVKMLEESIQCYEDVLTVITPEISPVGWVVTTGNLGDARLMLAMQLNGSDLARKATKDFGTIVDYFHNARLAKQLNVAKKHHVSAQSILQQIAG